MVQKLSVETAGSGLTVSELAAFTTDVLNAGGTGKEVPEVTTRGMWSPRIKSLTVTINDAKGEA